MSDLQDNKKPAFTEIKGLSTFDYLNNKPARAQLDKTIYGENLFADLTAKLPELDENSGSYAEDKIRYDEIFNKKTRANALINYYNFLSGYDKEGLNLRREKAEIEREFAGTYTNFSNEDVERFYSKKILDKIIQTNGDVGSIPENILMSKEFFENVDHSTFAYYASMHNHSKQGFWNSVSNGANLAEWNRNINVRADNGELSHKEVQELRFRVNSLYYNPNDNEVVSSTAGVLQNMYSVVKDNPWTFAGYATLAVLTGGVGGGMVASMFLAMPFASDTYQQAQGQQLIDAWDNGVIDTRENILRRSRYYSLAQGTFDLGVDAVTVRLFGLNKVVGSFIEKPMQKLLRKGGISYIAKTTESKGLLKDVAVTIGKVIGDGLMETYLSEGPQGALGAMALNAELGITGDEAWERVKTAYKENADEAKWPSFIIATGMGSVGLVHRNLHINRAKKELEQNAINMAQAEAGAHTPLAQNDPATNASILSKVLPSKAYFDPVRAQEVFEENGISAEDVPLSLRQKMDQAQHGDNVSLTSGEVAELPQPIRQALAPIATDIDGAITPEVLRADLKDEDLKRLQAEFREEVEKAVQDRTQEIEIENKINEQLYNASKNTKVKENNAIARLSSSFLRAMSKLADMDINELYEKFKPTFAFKNEDNLTKDKSVIDQEGVTGTFDSKTNTITLKENSDFATTLHETSHWFLNVMRELAKTNPQVEAEMRKLLKWAGIDNYINKLSDEEFNQLNEKFVAGFILSLVEGKTNLNGFGSFKKFINSLRNTSLFTGIREQNIRENQGNFMYSALGYQKKLSETKSDRLKKGFEQNYGEALPSINEEFTDFIDAIFASDVINEIQKTDYPIDDLLQDIDQANIAPELRENLKAEIKEAVKGLEEEIQEAIQSLTIKDVLLGMINGKDMKAVVENLMSNLSEEAKKNKDLMGYLNKLLEATEKFPKVKEKYIKRLQKDKTYQTLEKVKNFKLIGLQVPDAQQRKILESKGYIAKDGLGVTAKALFDNLYNEMSVEIKEYCRKKRLPKDQAFIQFLTETPSLEQKAEEMALAELTANFTNEMAKAMANLQTTIARNHKKVALATMKALNNTFGENKQDVEVMQTEIETVARMDVDQTIYSQASNRKYEGNARKENRRTKEAIAKGDLNQAMRSTRNEYYQNTKAEYITSVKNNVEKNIRAIKQFLNGSQAYISKNYDMDILEVLKMLLQQVGLSEQRSKYSISELKEILTNTYPEFADSIKEVLKQIEGNPQYKTFWQNQTVEQVQTLVQLMMDLKALARETKGYKVGNEIIDKKNTIDGLMGVLSKLKDVQASINMTVDGKEVTATNSKKTLWDRMKDIWRIYNNATKMVEFEMKKLDGKNMGMFHKVIYTPVKMAEIAYKKALIEHMNKLNDAFGKVKIRSGHIVCDEFIRADTGKPWCLGVGKFEGKATLEVIGILLHYGTNRDKFLNGYIQDKPNITDKKQQLAEKQKDFERWVQRMAQDGWITEEVLNFVQTVWDVNESIAPKLQMASREIRGFPFKRLATRNFTVKLRNGKVIHMRGGYVPALANKEVTGDVNHGEEPNFGVDDLQKEMPLVNPSYLLDRTDDFSQPLEIDPFILVGQVTDTLRYAYVMPAVMRVYRLLETKELKDMLERKAPRLRKDVIDPWLKSVATMSNTQPNSNALTRALGKMIQRSSMVIMTCNLNNTLQQISNLPTLLLRASPKNVLKAIYEVTCNTALWEQINKESDFMNVRLNERNDGLNEIFAELVVRSDQFEDMVAKGKYAYIKTSNYAQKHAFFMQKTFQNGLDRIGYIACKMDALEKGMSEEEAIRYAESSVRECFSSFDIADTTWLQKSTPLLKAFTMFGGYFYSMWRLCEMGISNSFRQYGITDYRRYLVACEYIFFAQIVPSIIAEAVQKSVGEGNPWDEDDDMDIYKSSYFLAPFRMSATAFPVLGKIVGSGLDRIEGKQYMSSVWLSTPWMTQADSLITAGKHIMSDADTKGRDVKAILNAIGILSGIPEFGILARSSSYLFDVNRGAVIPDSYYEWIRGLATGTAGEKGRQTSF